MVGLIQKILVDLVLKTRNEATLAEIQAQANIPVGKNFRIDTVYSDDEWQRFFNATKTVLNVTNEQFYKLYSKEFYNDARERFPMWFEMSKNSMEFLKRQPAIHNSFATGVANEEDRVAINDKFEVFQDGNALTTYYSSANKQCALYLALAKRIIDHYGDQATISEPECMLHGADQCKIVITWSELQNASK